MTDSISRLVEERDSAHPKDEGRIPFDDSGINYDWVTWLK